MGAGARSQVTMAGIHAGTGCWLHCGFNPDGASSHGGLQTDGRSGQGRGSAAPSGFNSSGDWCLDSLHRQVFLVSVICRMPLTFEALNVARLEPPVDQGLEP